MGKRSQTPLHTAKQAENGGYWGGYLRRARTARHCYGTFSRNGLGFPPCYNGPNGEKNPRWQARLLGRDRWPNLCAARAPRQVLIHRGMARRLNILQGCVCVGGGPGTQQSKVCVPKTAKPIFPFVKFHFSRQ